MRNAITHIETKSRPFDDAHTQDEHFVSCAFTEHGQSYVAVLMWRDSALVARRGPEVSDPGLAVTIYPADPDDPSKPFTWLDDVVDSDRIPQAPFWNLTVADATHRIEQALLRYVALRLNPGCQELVDNVLAHETLKRESRAGGRESLGLLRTIKEQLEYRGWSYETENLASLGARSAICYMHAV